MSHRSVFNSSMTFFVCLSLVGFKLPKQQGNLKIVTDLY